MSFWFLFQVRFPLPVATKYVMHSYCHRKVLHGLLSVTLYNLQIYTMLLTDHQAVTLQILLAWKSHCTNLLTNFWKKITVESERQHTWEKSRHHEYSCTLHKRLLKAEGEIQDLKAQIAYQRTAWEMRFMELQKRQHDLRAQVCAHSYCNYYMHLLN